MQKRYAVIYESGPNNWSAFSPDVDGCVATGKDREEVARNFADALTEHLRWMAEDGDTIPEPTCEVGYAQVDVPEPATSAA